MKRKAIGRNNYGKIYSIKRKKVDGIAYNLIEESDALGDAIYRIERSVFNGWHEAVGKTYKSIESALKAFDVAEYFN